MPVTFGWIFGAEDIDVRDTEKWAKIDGDYKIDNGAWKDLKFGVRYQAHDRTSPTGVAQGPLAPGALGELPDDVLELSVELQHFRRQYPDRTSGIGPRRSWRPTTVPPTSIAIRLRASTISTCSRCTKRMRLPLCKPISRATTGLRMSGMRYVQTKEDAISYTQVDPTTPGAVLTSAFGPFAGIEAKHTYNDVLPSANLKLDLTKDLVARFAASETMTRPDYSALAGFTNLTPPTPALPGAVGSTAVSGRAATRT